MASAVALPFADASFDFAVACMSLMDIPETERVLAETYRVLRPCGFFQFSIEHPCSSDAASAQPAGFSWRELRS